MAQVAPLWVMLPHGPLEDLSTAVVIRSVGEKESRAQDVRSGSRSEGAGPNWTVAIERTIKRRIHTLFTSDITVEELIAACAALQSRFVLIDNGRAAVARTAVPIVIRDFPQGVPGDNAAFVVFAGASSLGLHVKSTAAQVHQQLGAQAAHLSRIEGEGFIDRRHIGSVETMSAAKRVKVHGNPQCAVRFKGVRHTQYFNCDEATLVGAQVIDLSRRQKSQQTKR